MPTENDEETSLYFEDVIDVFSWAFACDELVLDPDALVRTRLRTTSRSILRSRYLLSKIDEEIVESLWQSSFNNAFGPHFSKKSPAMRFLGAPVWVIGILKYRSYIDLIVELIEETGLHQLCAVFLLFDETDALPVLEKISATTSEVLPRYCISLMRGETPTLVPGPKNVRFIGNLLRITNILRAGIQFTEPLELQRGLQRLLYDTTLVSDALQGRLHHQTPRRLRGTLQQFSEKCRAHRMETLAARTADASPLVREQEYRMTCQTHKSIVDQYLLGSPQPFVSGDRSLSEVTFSYFQSKGSHAQRVHTCGEELIRELADETENFIDIARTLEIDAIHGHFLSADIIITLFERLKEYIPASINFMEEYAYALLMRGSQFDNMAQQLLSAAAQVKSQYVYVGESESEYYYESDYYMVKG